MGSQRVGHNWVTSLLHLFSWCLNSQESTYQCRRLKFDPWIRKVLWKKKWKLTPIFLPWKSHGQRSLAGYSPWGCKGIGYDLAAKQQQHFKPLNLWHFYTEVANYYISLHSTVILARKENVWVIIIGQCNMCWYRENLKCASRWHLIWDVKNT